MPLSRTVRDLSDTAFDLANKKRMSEYASNIDAHPNPIAFVWALVGLRNLKQETPSNVRALVRAGEKVYVYGAVFELFSLNKLLLSQEIFNSIHRMLVVANFTDACDGLREIRIKEGQKIKIDDFRQLVEDPNFRKTMIAKEEQLRAERCAAADLEDGRAAMYMG